MNNFSYGPEAPEVIGAKGIGGTTEINIKRAFQLTPAGGTTDLLAVTLPRHMRLGTSVTTDAKEFCALAALVESLL